MYINVHQSWSKCYKHLCRWGTNGVSIDNNNNIIMKFMWSMCLVCDFTPQTPTQAKFTCILAENSRAVWSYCLVFRGPLQAAGLKGVLATLCKNLNQIKLSFFRLDILGVVCVSEQFDMDLASDRTRCMHTCTWLVTHAAVVKAAANFCICWRALHCILVVCTTRQIFHSLKEYSYHNDIVLITVLVRIPKSPASNDIWYLTSPCYDMLPL